MSTNDISGMRPRKGQTTMSLPLTFDYSGGRRDKVSSVKIWSVVIVIVGFIIGIGTILNKKGFFITNFAIGVIILYATLFVVRFLLLKEGHIRTEYIGIKDRDYKLNEKEIWGIYDISRQYPYICRFRNGKSGIIVRLNKDVILGKYSDAEYEHFEAIADAYNICGSSNIQMCHADYMDVIGNDERLDESFSSLKNVSNPDLRDLLTDIYSYQKEQMSKRVTTYDAYVFLWRGSDRSAWNTIKQILNCFMQANYRSYQVLNEDELRELPKSIFNLEEFSAVFAMLNSFDSKLSSGIIPIKLERADGSVEVLGKTLKEKREERALEERRAEIQKQSKKSTNQRTYQESGDLDIDLGWDDEINIDE